MRPKTLTAGQVKSAWDRKHAGESVKAIAADMGVPAPTLYRSLQNYVEPGQLQRPTRAETVEKIRAFAGPDWASRSAEDRMRMMFMLRGETLSDAVLCEAMGVKPATFSAYLQHTTGRGSRSVHARTGRSPVPSRRFFQNQIWRTRRRRILCPICARGIRSSPP